MTPDDSARNRKMRKMMSLNSSICLMPILGLERYTEFGLPKVVLPSIVRLPPVRPAQCAHWKGSATNRALLRSTPLSGILFFDAWRIEPTLDIPSNLPSAQDAPEEDTTASSPTSPRLIKPKPAKKEARDILARAAKNQADDGSITRRALQTSLYAMVNQHGLLIQRTYEAGKEHAIRSKGTEQPKTPPCRPRPQELPTVPPELTSELLHCFSTLSRPVALPKSQTIWIVLARGYRKWEDFSLTNM